MREEGEEEEEGEKGAEVGCCFEAVSFASS